MKTHKYKKTAGKWKHKTLNMLRLQQWKHPEEQKQTGSNFIVLCGLRAASLAQPVVATSRVPAATPLVMSQYRGCTRLKSLRWS